MKANSQIFISNPQARPIDMADFSFHLAGQEMSTFQVNGEIVNINREDGIFINANQSFSQNADTLCLAVGQDFWQERSQWKEKVEARIPQTGTFPYVILHHDVPEQQSILDGMKILDGIQRETPEAYAFLSPGIIYSMFQALVEQINEE